jgi:hypothetical protein
MEPFVLFPVYGSIVRLFDKLTVTTHHDRQKEILKRTSRSP